MSNDFVKQNYNKVAENYDRGRDQFESDIYLKKLNSLLSPHSVILDIGCGTGKPVDTFLVNKGHIIIGIDISEKMIEFAKTNVPSGDYKVADMSELRTREYTVDAVVSFYAIFHTRREAHQELLNKISSFLPKGGLLLITMGSSDYEGKESNFFGGEMLWSHYNSKKNTEIVKKANFEILMNTIDTSRNERHQVILARKS